LKIAVVGTGVAGAYLLNRIPSEHQVEAFEMKTEKNWYTPCGWGTSEPFIRDLVKKAGFNFEDYVLHRGRKMIVNLGDEELEIPLKGLVTYDKHRLTHDMIKGKMVHWGEHVKEADGQLKEFDVVVDATGLHRSLLPRVTNDILIPSLEYQVKSRDLPYDDFVIRPYPGITGYWWHFPLGDGVAHVGAGDLRGAYRGELEAFVKKYNCEVLRKVGRPVRVTPPRMMEPFFEGKVVGVGECLPPSSEIVTHEGLRRISEVNVGDLVLTHKGTFKPVKRKFERLYEGDLIAIRTAMSPYRELLTPEHPVLWMKEPRTKHRNLEFIAARNCRKGTYVAVPNPSTWWSPENRHVIESGFRYPTKEELRLSGYYLSEGSVTLPSSNSRTYAVEFSFGSHESEYIEDTRSILSRTWGEPYVYERNNCTKVILKRKAPAIWYSGHFGTHSYAKRIPYSLSKLDYCHTAELLKGLVYGDGTWDDRRIRYATASPELAWQTRWLVSKFGAVASISSRENSGFAKISGEGKTIYELTWAGEDSERLRESLGAGPRRSGNRSWSLAHQTHEWTFYPITSAERVPYRGVVYNLEVADHNTFVTKSFAVHNCIGTVYPMLGEGIIPSMQCADLFVEHLGDRDGYRKAVLDHYAVYSNVFKFIKAKIDKKFSLVKMLPTLLSIYWHMRNNETRYGIRVRLSDFYKIATRL
jgi:flavin-dependent dehydrogenase